MSMHPLDVLNATERHRQILIAENADLRARLKEVRGLVWSSQVNSIVNRALLRVTDLRVRDWEGKP